jgi:hypothetical protein
MSIINLLVEGDLDEAAAVRLVETVGHTPGVCYGKKGLSYITTKIQGFNNSVYQVPCLALVDFMDTNLDCPPEVITQLLPIRNPNMLLRVVVRELESWLLADRNNIARFLQINIDQVPIAPEQIHDPKQTLVNLARRSRSSKLRSALVPNQGSTAQVGKLYASEMKRFISELWNIESARTNADSLDRCLSSLESLN